jgi:hypothetical protein
MSNRNKIGWALVIAGAGAGAANIAWGDPAIGIADLLAALLVFAILISKHLEQRPSTEGSSGSEQRE